MLVTKSVFCLTFFALSELVKHSFAKKIWKYPNFLKNAILYAYMALQYVPSRAELYSTVAYFFFFYCKKRLLKRKTLFCMPHIFQTQNSVQTKSLRWSMESFKAVYGQSCSTGKTIRYIFHLHYALVHRISICRWFIFFQYTSSTKFTMYL